MVTIETVRLVNASALIKSRPIVAVFPGGTSGIGAYAIQQLVTHHKNNNPNQHSLRVYIVGRNIPAANKIIEECKAISSTAELIFVRTEDLSLLKNVDKACEEIKRLEEEKSGGEARLDLLVMSHADLHFGARRETPGGLDKSLSLLYYSRMRFTVQLLPLLLCSRSAHIISIYAAGLEKGLPRFHASDLSLRSPQDHSFVATRTHATVMTTFFFESLAKHHEGKLSLTHWFPGLVITPAFKASSHPWWFKLLWALLGPYMKRFVAVGAEETGERVLALADGEKFPAVGGVGKDAAYGTDGVRGSGAYSVDSKGETNDLVGLYAPMRKEKFGEMVCKHMNMHLRRLSGARPSLVS